LAALMIVMIFALTNAASAKADEAAPIANLGTGLVPAYPGTFLTIRHPVGRFAKPGRDDDPNPDDQQHWRC
jgi:hypothetical protein